MSAKLKMTGIKLELMANVDQFHFIEKGMRGGISYIAHRYGTANNRYIKNYDGKKPNRYLMYLDVNNRPLALRGYVTNASFKQ